MLFSTKIRESDAAVLTNVTAEAPVAVVLMTLWLTTRRPEAIGMPVSKRESAAVDVILLYATVRDAPSEKGPPPIDIY